MIHIGTSGWQYASWKGRFYPKGLPQRAWLEHYAERFPTVEVNNSFYRLPNDTTFDSWRDRAPKDFLYAVKASRYITHIRRLKNAKDSVDLFWSRASRLKGTLGPVLFQTPPNLQADTGKLREFLSLLPSGMRAAFEFRHGTWLSDEVLELLDGAGAAWVLADRPGWRVPEILTGGWSYIRFHQGRATHPCYARSKLRAWADRIARMRASDVFVYFNNDELACAPADAEALTDLLEQRGKQVATARS
jgi:uncharacterized protein YecE (DUF72 family)